MFRAAVRVASLTLVALMSIVMSPASNAATAVPQPAIVQPPDRFFQEGSSLDVVVSYGLTSTGARRTNFVVQLIADGAVIAEGPLPAAGAVSTFTVPVNPQDPIALIQVCVGKSGGAPDDRACTRVRAAGTRELDSLRRTLEEMNEIADAVARYSITRLGWRGVPQSLDELVPDFLASVPSTSPFASHYVYTAAGEHFALRLALPGVGEIVNEDGAFTKLPHGSITDREAARLIRQDLTELATAVESYRVDNNVFPTSIDEIAPIYSRFPHLMDPYGRPYMFALAPDAYVLSGLGRDGLPGGEGFDADSKVTNGMQLVATTPYRGRNEYFRRTIKDMSQVSAALNYFQEENGRWPASLSELIGGPWFSWPREFNDDCGNPYEYHVYDLGFGRNMYQLRAHSCHSATYTDPWDDLLYFAADNEGYYSNPAGSWVYRFPGLFD